MVREYDRMASVGWVGLPMTMTDRKVEEGGVSRRQNKKKKKKVYLNVFKLRRLGFPRGSVYLTYTLLYTTLDYNTCHLFVVLFLLQTVLFVLHKIDPNRFNDLGKILFRLYLIITAKFRIILDLGFGTTTAKQSKLHTFTPILILHLPGSDCEHSAVL